MGGITSIMGNVPSHYNFIVTTILNVIDAINSCKLTLKPIRVDIYPETDNLSEICKVDHLKRIYFNASAIEKIMQKEVILKQGSDYAVARMVVTKYTVKAIFSLLDPEAESDILDVYTIKWIIRNKNKFRKHVGAIDFALYADQILQPCNYSHILKRELIE